MKTRTDTYQPANRHLRRKARTRLHSFCIALLLALSMLSLAPVHAGDSTVEIPVPKEVEKGLESVGIRLESTSSWTGNSGLWIGGGIVLAGLAIAYAIYSKKR